MCTIILQVCFHLLNDLPLPLKKYPFRSVLFYLKNWIESARGYVSKFFNLFFFYLPIYSFWNISYPLAKLAYTRDFHNYMEIWFSSISQALFHWGAREHLLRGYTFPPGEYSGLIYDALSLSLCLLLEFLIWSLLYLSVHSHFVSVVQLMTLIFYSLFKFQRCGLLYAKQYSTLLLALCIHWVEKKKKNTRFRIVITRCYFFF